MTLMGKSNPLGGAVCAYTPGTILFDGSNGDSAMLQMKKGFYFIRGQGAGAGGGNCGLYGTGGGGGSGAGFEGNVYIADNQNDVNCYAGIAEEANRKDGEASYIGGLMNMGGGHIGGSDRRHIDNIRKHSGNFLSGTLRRQSRQPDHRQQRHQRRRQLRTYQFRRRYRQRRFCRTLRHRTRSRRSRRTTVGRQRWLRQIRRTENPIPETQTIDKG